MDNRMERINMALGTIRAKLAEHDALLGAIAQLREENAAAAAFAHNADLRAERWRALAEMPVWAELESGASVAAGDRVRYLLGTYECTAAHQKALTRRPTNPAYWTEVPA